MSDISRLYDEVRRAVPNCSYVRVPHWNLRTTWEAVPFTGRYFSRAENDKIEQIFAAFVLNDEGTQPDPLDLDITPTLHQRMVDMEREQKELERRVLTLELRLSALLEGKADHGDVGAAH